MKFHHDWGYAKLIRCATRTPSIDLFGLASTGMRQSWGVGAYHRLCVQKGNTGIESPIDDGSDEAIYLIAVKHIDGSPDRARNLLSQQSGVGLNLPQHHHELDLEAQSYTILTGGIMPIMGMAGKLMQYGYLRRC